MSIPHSLFHVRRLIVLLVLLMMIIGQKPSHAQDNAPAPHDPHTPVTNTGSLPPKFALAPDAVISPSTGSELPSTDEPQEEVSINSIIGPDSRKRILNTLPYPYGTIVHLYVSYPLAEGECSGVLISPDTVLTAGHCVFTKEHGGWADFIIASPGRNGSNTFPHPPCPDKQLFSTTGWIHDLNPSYDYGVIKLTCSYTATGWMGVRAAPDAGLRGQTTILTGYPSDKPLGTMWNSQDQNDATQGQSGSPVWNRNDITCNPCVFAIHTDGVSPGTGGNNGGVRIDAEIMENLWSWIAP